MKKVTLSVKNTSLGLGVGRTILFWLLLDKLQVSGVTWGVFWTLTVILSILSLVDYFGNQTAEIMEDGSIKIS